jgi:hypothetical protein
VIDQHTVRQSVVVREFPGQRNWSAICWLMAVSTPRRFARQDMLQSLPDYMVPRHFVTLDAFH